MFFIPYQHGGQHGGQRGQRGQEGRRGGPRGGRRGGHQRGGRSARQLGRRGQVGLRKVKIDVLQGDLAHHADGDLAHADGDVADAYQQRGQGEQRGGREMRQGRELPRTSRQRGTKWVMQVKDSCKTGLPPTTCLYSSTK